MSSQSQSLNHRGSNLIFGFAVFFSGMAALGHQLLWTRRLIDLLGASGEATARVLGTFFLGLSVGAAIAAIWLGGIRNPLRFAGWVQLSIPILVLPVICSSGLTDWIWPAIGSESTRGATGSFIRSVLTLGLVFPPTVMMGLSFPLVVTGVLRLTDGTLGQNGVNLYAINTLGGACGVLFTVMVALPQFGNLTSMVLAAVVDGLVGLVLLMLSAKYGRLHGTRQNQSAALGSPGGSSFSAWQPLGIAFFSGMAVLAIEVAALQMFQLVATISLFSPAAVLFCAIASLGIAAAVFSRFAIRIPADKRPLAIAGVLAASGVLVVAAPQVFTGIAQRSNWFAGNSGVADFVFSLGLLAILSVGPAWFVAGMIFPFALAFATDNIASGPGQRLGALLAVNGLGGLLGAELTYVFLLPAFGVYGTMAAIGLAFGLVAFAVSVFCGTKSERIFARAAAVASSVLVLMLSLFNSLLPVVNPPKGIASIDIRSGREGTVAVLENEEGERSILFANQYLLGGTSVRYDQERQVLLPMILHEKPREIACIGLATGITPGAALTLPRTERVTAVEISPLVARAAEDFFGEFNHNICNDPSADIVIGDGRTYIASTANRFDVITGDLFLPWGPGTSRLYSAEHFSAVRRALKADGIFCQWLPMYQLTPEQFQLIANTFQSQFGETWLFLNHFRVAQPMLALVAIKSTAGLDWDRIEKRCDELAKQGAILDPVLRHEPSLRMLDLGQWQGDARDTQLVSLADPTLEYSAATVRLSDNPTKRYYNPASWIRFCREQVGGDAVNPSNASQNTVGLLELDYAIRAKHKLANSIALRVANTLPVAMIDDLDAEWQRWPGAAVNKFFGAQNTSNHSNK